MSMNSKKDEKNHSPILPTSGESTATPTPATPHKPTPASSDPSSHNPRSTGRSLRTWFKSLPAAQQVALLAPVIVALIGLVGALIGPLPTWLRKSTIPTPSDSGFYYGVHVRAKDQDTEISRAHVTIETVGGLAPIDGFTDSTGYTRLRIPASHIGQPGRLIVEKSGYNRWEQNIDLTPDSLPDVIELEPNP